MCSKSGCYCGTLIFSSEKILSVTHRHVRYQTPWFYFLRGKMQSLDFIYGLFVYFLSWCLEAWLDYLCMEPHLAGVTESVVVNVQF